MSALGAWVLAFLAIIVVSDWIGGTVVTIMRPRNYWQLASCVLSAVAIAVSVTLFVGAFVLRFLES